MEFLILDYEGHSSKYETITNYKGYWGGGGIPLKGSTTSRTNPKNDSDLHLNLLVVRFQILSLCLETAQEGATIGVGTVYENLKIGCVIRYIILRNNMY